MQQSPGKRLFLCLISGWGVRFNKLLSSAINKHVILFPSQPEKVHRQRSPTKYQNLGVTSQKIKNGIWFCLVNALHVANHKYKTVTDYSFYSFTTVYMHCTSLNCYVGVGGAIWIDRWHSSWKSILGTQKFQLQTLVRLPPCRSLQHTQTWQGMFAYCQEICEMVPNPPIMLVMSHGSVFEWWLNHLGMHLSTAL